jgi:hypothetical protein
MTLSGPSESLVTPRLVQLETNPKPVVSPGRSLPPGYRLISYRPENSITSPDAVRNFT